MLFQRYSEGLEFYRLFLPSMLRSSFKAFARMNWQARRGLLRISSRRAAMWLPNQIEQYRSGVQFPKALNLVDDVGCRASCSNCIFTSFYHRRDHLSLEDIDRLLDEALGMNTTNVMLMGADPFYRDNIDEFLDLLARHRYQMFFLFTEGKRVKKEHLERIRRAGNIVLLINLDGLEEATDSRKGAGTFPIVDRLFRDLSQYRMIFGVSCMVSKANFSEVTSSEFIQYLDRHGAYFLAYVPYTPVDVRKETDLILSESEREMLFERALQLNKIARRLVVFDLLGIEEKLTECPAARYSVTVHHDGTVTPCVAIPAGCKESNVKHRMLKEIFIGDPLYKAIRSRNEEIKRRNRKQGTHDRMRCMFFTDKQFLKEYFDEHQAEMNLLAPFVNEWLETETGGKS